MAEIDFKTFIGLPDTPSSYSGLAKDVVRVNPSGDALEFTTVLDELTRVQIIDSSL